VAPAEAVTEFVMASLAVKELMVLVQVAVVADLEAEILAEVTVVTE
jgi:hypothetical protein